MQQINEQKPSTANKKIRQKPNFFKTPLYIRKAVPYLVDLVSDEVDSATKGHVMSISLLLKFSFQ